MNKRAFTTKIEQHHRRWLSETIHVPVPENTGIDLADEDVGIELKSKYKLYTLNYAIHAYQIHRFQEENEGKQLFWGFLSYDLRKPVEKIYSKENLANVVFDVEILFMEWDFVKQFPVASPPTGPYVYVHSNRFPARENFKILFRNNAKLYVPRGTILEEKINSTEMIEKYEKNIEEQNAFLKKY
jgi:hypothetical protein